MEELAYVYESMLGHLCNKTRKGFCLKLLLDTQESFHLFRWMRLFWSVPMLPFWRLQLMMASYGSPFFYLD